MKNNFTYYIVGHKNPDTDSIASAIGYAFLKNKLGYKKVIPARIGFINQQTNYILKQLNINPPFMLNNIKTRVKDVMTENVKKIEFFKPLNDALTIFENHKIRYLPVTDKNNVPVGILTLSIVTHNLLKLLDTDKTITSVKSILNVIKGKCLTKNKDINFKNNFKSKIILTTGSKKVLIQNLKTNPDIPKIIVTDDRTEILNISDKYNVKIIIFSKNFVPDKKIIELSKKLNIVLISTKLNSSKTAFMLKQCIPVNEIYDKKFFTVKPKTELDKARELLENNNVKGIMVTDKKNQLCGVITRSTFLKKIHRKIILVDHNEPTQAIEGIDNIEITEIVDHHKIATFQTTKPITFINYPVGSASSIIGLLFKNHNVIPTKKIASLLISGILSDTVILKSPTTTDFDKNILKWLNKFAKLNYNKFAQKFFKAGSVINIKKIENTIKSDFKIFEMNNNKVGIGQIETVGFVEINKHKQKFLKKLKDIYKTENFDFIGLMISDISIQSSIMFVFCKENIYPKIPWSEIEDNLYELKNVLSRKKQVVPALMRILE